MRVRDTHLAQPAERFVGAPQAGLDVVGDVGFVALQRGQQDHYSRGGAGQELVQLQRAPVAGQVAVGENGDPVAGEPGHQGGRERVGALGVGGGRAAQRGEGVGVLLAFGEEQPGEAGGSGAQRGGPVQLGGEAVGLAVDPAAAVAVALLKPLVGAARTSALVADHLLDRAAVGGGVGVDPHPAPPVSGRGGIGGGEARGQRARRRGPRRRWVSIGSPAPGGRAVRAVRAAGAAGGRRTGQPPAARSPPRGRRPPRGS
ncbi:hypothetical protein F0Q45_25395 [Mycobacterium simiae]|uniref:Uncharacterized protein n=1 Tax=Mycobacterium simiae TaxID=1784 RepID=A0A5B1B9M3_MYCSI|nr:hypothetical protein F0Q45_25395 [Mycobacterium simiae]